MQPPSVNHVLKPQFVPLKLTHGSQEIQTILNLASHGITDN